MHYPKGIKPLENYSHINLFPNLFLQLAPKSFQQIQNIYQGKNYSIFEDHIMAVNGKPNSISLFWDKDKIKK